MTNFIACNASYIKANILFFVTLLRVAKIAKVCKRTRMSEILRTCTWKLLISLHMVFHSK